jgi:uncharacterized protein YmfQ (DUF2313 family)
MPCYGGLTPAPRRMGGGKPRVKVIVDALNASRGTAYDTSQTSTVYADNLALARALAGAWSTNVRMGNQWTPSKMTTSLGRWETILGIAPAYGSADATRRAAIADRFSQVGVASTRQALYDRLAAKFSQVLVALEYLTTATANITVPSASPAYPFGTVNSVGWTSEIASVYVRLQQPASYTDNAFYSAAALVVAELDALLPAWVMPVWYRPGATFTAITNGPSAAGFYLDDAHNLDNEIFDS